MLKESSIFFIFLSVCQLAFGQLTINEASNTNDTTIVLPDGTSPDWIELYNGGTAPTNLLGYGLSDDSTHLMKWIFPETTIQPMGFLTVFATGKSTFNPVDHYETAVFAESTWNYIIPTGEITDWNATTFNSGSWLTGAASIGYGDGDDATDVGGPHSTIYSRISFQCTNITAIAEAILDIDYDDGFVAYLNGVEIARSGLNGTPPPWDELSADHEATIYQGGQISTFTLDLSTIQAALVIGTNVLAIELHNSSLTSSDLTCKPYLTFGYDQPGVFASGTVHPYFSLLSGALESNFKLSTAGETIYLSDPSGILIDSLVVWNLEPNMSNGKFPDGSTATALFAVPTPNATNTASDAFDGYEIQPTIVNVGGVFMSPNLTVSVVNNSVSGGELRYTTNGTDPDVSSPLFTGPLVLTSNSVLKVTCFPVGSNLLPSITETETFLFAEEFEIPIVLLTVDSADLYGADGIFDNWWTDWKKPCVVEYFDKNGVKQFESRASVKPDGGAGGSRSHPQHSVTVEPANSVFGEGLPVQYPLIPQKPFINEYYAFYLRNGSNYWNQYPQRDALFTRMMSKTHVNAQGYTPTVVFLNGNYFGVYELREKANEGYFENNYGNDRDSLDLLSVSYFYGPSVIRTVKGSDSSFYSMRDFIANTDPSSPTYFSESHKRLDLYNFADYMAGENWFGNVDWIYNNMKMARTRTYDNKWRFFLQDLEYGIGYATDYNVNMFDWFIGASQGTPFWDIYNGLQQNPEFRSYYINRYADLMNTTFQFTEYGEIMSSMHNELLADLPRSLQLWAGSADLSNYNNIHQMHLDQFGNRNGVVRDQMVSHFNLVERVNVTLDVFPEGAGYIKISTIVPDELPWAGVYFNGNPVKITAIANPGYTFQSWDSNATLPNSALTQASVTYNIPSDDLFRAVFVGSPEPQSVTISEINYNPDPSVDGGNWIELHNFGTATVDLTAWQIKTKHHWEKFTFEDQTMLNPGAYLVICADTALFHATYPQVNNVVGGTGFGCSNKWDSIRVYNPFNELVLSVHYTDEKPFPKCADGWGRTLENNDLTQLPLDSLSWFCGCIGGSPGEPYSPCEEPIVVSEFNYNNSSYDAVDWIELFNNTSATINLQSYVFKDSQDDNVYTFPAMSLEPDSFVVLANNLSLFSERHPYVENVVGGEFNFGLSSTDGVRIYNDAGRIINSFMYDTVSPWPVIPPDSYVTNEYNFYTGYVDPNNGLSWFLGCEGGSPGRAFSPCPVLPDGENLFLYPNPTEDLINIAFDNSGNNSGSTDIEIFDMHGKIVESFNFLSNESTVLVQLHLGEIRAGVYYLRVRQTGMTVQKPFVKM